MTDHGGLPQVGGYDHDLWNRDRRFSLGEIQAIVDARCKVIVDERLGSIGLTMGEETSKTAAMVESWKTMSKGLRGFVMSTLSSVALSGIGLAWYFLTGQHKQ